MALPAPELHPAYPAPGALLRVGPARDIPGWYLCRGCYDSPNIFATEYKLPEGLHLLVSVVDITVEDRKRKWFGLMPVGDPSCKLWWVTEATMFNIFSGGIRRTPRDWWHVV